MNQVITTHKNKKTVLIYGVANGGHFDFQISLAFDPTHMKIKQIAFDFTSEDGAVKDVIVQKPLIFSCSFIQGDLFTTIYNETSPNAGRPCALKEQFDNLVFEIKQSINSTQRFYIRDMSTALNVPVFNEGTSQLADNPLCTLLVDFWN